MKAKRTQAEIRLALEQTGGHRAHAAKLLGMSDRAFYSRLSRMKDVPPAPTTVFPIVPEGHKLAGVSSLQKIVDPTTGDTVLQWVKTAADAQKREETCKAALDALLSEVPRVLPESVSVGKRPAELASLYIITDYHLGMMAWGEETGAPWDLKIAEDLLVNWFAYAIQHSPAASQGVLAQLGDFLHYDSLEAVTPKSRNLLDSDTRPQKMIRVALRVLRRVIDMMLEKHETVHVLMAEGNHDPMSSAWLREAFKLLYEYETRVTVETRPDPYYAFEWGDTALLFHHGHLRNPKNVDDVLVRKFRELYGKAKKVYAHMGHMHHEKSIESTLMVIEQHPTLAAQDAYASRGGWLSDRLARVITYHKTFGEVGRMGITPEMVKGAA